MMFHRGLCGSRTIAPSGSVCCRSLTSRQSIQVKDCVDSSVGWHVVDKVDPFQKECRNGVDKHAGGTAFGTSRLSYVVYLSRLSSRVPSFLLGSLAANGFRGALNGKGTNKSCCEFRPAGRGSGKALQVRHARVEGHLFPLADGPAAHLGETHGGGPPRRIGSRQLGSQMSVVVLGEVV